MRLFGTGKWAFAVVGLLAATSLMAAACGGDDDDDTTATNTTASGSPVASATAGGLAADIGKGDSANLTGAGATFPAPIYQAWFDDYNKKVAKDVKVNYQPVGSGGGISQFTAGTVDFGASDVGMSDAQLTAAPDAQLLPTVLGAVVVTYNVPELKSPLKLDGPTLANIYLGNIKKWNDAAIAALNSGVSLPDKDIQVAYRSDSSGTSGVFTDYLSKVSDEWKTKVGQATAPKWPVGQGGQGNDGVTNVVKQTPYALGYVELTYAKTNKLAFADMKNKAGKFVTPSIDGTSASAASVTLPADYRLSITNADGDTAYPISSFTYLILPKSKGKCTQQTPLVDMLWWAYHDKSAQTTITELNYAPLPTNLLPKIEATLKSLKCDDGAKTSLKGG
ncbi:MAG: phosphate ABC transporter substrate-binding protein PstS [bacterium]